MYRVFPTSKTAMMGDLKKILVPVDFSETSFNALDTAVVLAKKNNAELAIIYARDTIPELVPQNAPRGRVRENSQAIMNAYITAIEHKHQVKPQLIWEEGLPAEAIIRTARRQEPDLIVCGSHGASGYRDSFIGSTAYTIIKYATCPVLTIPAGGRRSSFRKLLLPVRPIHGALRNYDVFLNIAAESSEVHVLDLSGNNEDDEQLVSFIVEEWKDKIEGHNVKVQITKASGATIPERVFNMINRDRYDILLLTPSLDMTNKQLFIGPHTQKIINQSTVPVLVIKRNL